MQQRDETIAAAIEPVLATLGLELFDVQFAGTGRARTLRVVVDRDGGVDLDAITAATERIGPILDEHQALAGPFALEVSSPGLERTLRRPDHFRQAVGETVSVKTRDAGGEVRRLRGKLLGADDDGITVDVGDAPEHAEYDEVVDARTVFEWGPVPKRAKGEKRTKRAKKAVAR